ncbi:MAG: type II secretion system protein GspG [Verrucomicrobiota bacterium]
MTPGINRFSMVARNRMAAFTIIEMMVVITIISILAGLVLSTAGYVQRKGATSRATGEIAAMAAALENYKADNGDYPLNSNSGNNTALLNALMPNNGGKIYYEFKTNSITNNTILDPFGIIYCYLYPGQARQNGTNFYDLWSSAGGSGSSAKWIKNW